mmetsp:Transcript_117126/g.377982  ORF Transcript_117126/g.377982 Transcript_117126/m.377982 type:complete len:357 (-) Transcript_117126:2206-3276(-)
MRRVCLQVHCALVAGQGDETLLVILLGLALHAHQADALVLCGLAERLDDLTHIELADRLAALHRHALGHGNDGRAHVTTPKLVQEVLLLDLAGAAGVHAAEGGLELVLGEHGVLVLAELRQTLAEGQELGLGHDAALAQLLEEVLWRLGGLLHVRLDRVHGVRQEDGRRQVLLVAGQGRGDLGGHVELLLERLNHVGGVLQQPLGHELVLLVPQQALLLVQVALDLRELVQHLADLGEHRGVRGDALGIALAVQQQVPHAGQDALRLRLCGAGLLASALHGLGRHICAALHEGRRGLCGGRHLLLHLRDLLGRLALDGGGLPLGHPFLRLAQLLGHGVKPGLVLREALLRALEGVL